MLYLDTSALIKKYVEEDRSNEVRALISGTSLIATCSVTRAETAAALSRAVRIGSLTSSAGNQAHKAFIREWKSYVRVRVTESLIEEADGLAWRHKLRGYDAIHLAAVLEWQDSIGETVTLATFDRYLWIAAGETGVERFPLSLYEKTG